MSTTGANYYNGCQTSNVWRRNMSRSRESRPRGSRKQQTKITFAARARTLNRFKKISWAQGFALLAHSLLVNCRCRHSIERKILLKYIVLDTLQSSPTSKNITPMILSGRVLTLKNLQITDLSQLTHQPHVRRLFLNSQKERTKQIA